jgi:hypothetical protein
MSIFSAELDSISLEVQSRAASLKAKDPRKAADLMKVAERIDAVANELETSGKTSSKTAGAEPFEEFGPENEHQDRFEASDYHKVPVGNDSMSKALDKNLSQIVSELEFGQTGNAKDKQRINIQASKAWPFKDLKPEDLARMASSGDWGSIERAAKMARTAGKTAAEMEVDEDTTGGADTLSTADLAETGDEAATPPVDADEVGGVLQFYGTDGPGKGPDSGHHGPTASKKSWARRVLLASLQEAPEETAPKTAAEAKVPVKVKQPDALLTDGPGEDVERDQELGGLSSKHSSTEIKLYRPTHVPAEMNHVWVAAGRALMASGKLLNKNNRVNYNAVNEKYVQILNHMSRTASSVK